jgi:hypothetical protein
LVVAGWCSQAPSGTGGNWQRGGVVGNVLAWLAASEAIISIKTTVHNLFFKHE